MKNIYSPGTIKNEKEAAERGEDGAVCMSNRRLAAIICKELLRTNKKKEADYPKEKCIQALVSTSLKHRTSH